jgi:uncharacterized RDD family membrane protein YckC
MATPTDPFSAYESPSAPVGADVPEPASGFALVPASLGKRFLNVTIDTVPLFVLQMVTYGVAATLMFPNLDPSSDEAEAALGLLMIPLTWVPYFAYYIIMEATIGRTIGKMVTGTRVVRGDGRSAPTLWQIVGRTSARLVPFEALTFLFGEPSGWHDDWSQTMVIDERRKF